MKQGRNNSGAKMPKQSTAAEFRGLRRDAGGREPTTAKRERKEEAARRELTNRFGELQYRPPRD